MSAAAAEEPLVGCGLHWCVRDPEGSRTWVCARCEARIPFNVGGDP